MSTGTPAVAPAITTFKAKYELAAHDARTIARQLSAFDIIQGARNLTPAEVVNRLHALTLEGSPCPLLVLETDTARAAGTVRVYHAPAVCPNLTDRPHHEWMDRSFISHGDIFNKETDIYEQPADFTSLVSRGTAMRCLHHQQIVTAFHDDPNLQILGPFDAAEPNTEAIITRRICFLPPRFAAQLLDSTMSPRDAYFTITNMVLNVVWLAQDHTGDGEIGISGRHSGVEQLRCETWWKETDSAGDDGFSVGLSGIKGTKDL